MPKKVKELSALEIKNITKPGRHAVGSVAGLQLVVKPDSGARSWMLRIVIGGKRRSLGLGGYPDVTLAEARRRAREVKRLIDEGIDPLEERRSRRRTLMNMPDIMSFREAAGLCHQKKSSNSETLNMHDRGQYLTDSGLEPH